MNLPTKQWNLVDAIQKKHKPKTILIPNWLWPPPPFFAWKNSFAVPQSCFSHQLPGANLPPHYPMIIKWRIIKAKENANALYIPYYYKIWHLLRIPNTRLTFGVPPATTSLQTSSTHFSVTCAPASAARHWASWSLVLRDNCEWCCFDPEPLCRSSCR